MPYGQANDQIIYVFAKLSQTSIYALQTQTVKEWELVNFLKDTGQECYNVCHAMVW